MREKQHKKLEKIRKWLIDNGIEPINTNSFLILYNQMYKVKLKLKK